MTVVVPTNSVGRRDAAAAGVGGAGADHVARLGCGRGDASSPCTGLAELLAAPVLAAAGRRPVSTPVVAAAVRGALAEAPGLFAPVAEHPATEEALAAVHRELSDLDDAALDVLARQSARARDVVRIAPRGARRGWRRPGTPSTT